MLASSNWVLLDGGGKVVLGTVAGCGASTGDRLSSERHEGGAVSGAVCPGVGSAMMDADADNNTGAKCRVESVCLAGRPFCFFPTK